MKDEIKEILDRLERIDHKEYTCPFEFADSSSFTETARCFKERKMLADHITNLQEEVNKLTAESTEWENKFYIEANKNEKAIEYINTHYLNANEPELLNILQGSDNNVRFYN